MACYECGRSFSSEEPSRVERDRASATSTQSRGLARRSPWLRLIGCLAVALCCLCGVADAAEQPWESAPFAADPDSTLAALLELPVPENESLEVLWNELTIEFDGEGRTHTTRRRVSRCLTPTGVQQSSATTAKWSPWNQQRPEIKVRVITADGESHWLAPDTVSEQAADESQHNIFSDRKTLVAPLPAVAVGCVIEELVTIRETRPFFKSGVTRRVPLISLSPVRHQRVNVVAPADVPLRHKVQGLELTPQIHRDSDHQRLRFDISPVPRLTKFEEYTTRSQPPYPVVTLSTGESWQRIAHQYSQIVESKTDSKLVKPVTKGLVTSDMSNKQAAEKCLAKLHSMIRYTGLEFGQSAIVPYNPDETLTRRYGDCKDQSTLLVAMLREVGREAHVALLRAGLREAVQPELPGINAFDHVIVYVPGSPPLWIDPTDPYTPVGELPLSDQGRLALVASEKTKHLVLTPRATADENLSVIGFDIQFTFQGKTKIQESQQYFGTVASRMRGTYAALSPAEIRQSWQSEIQAAYASKALDDLKYTAPGDMTKPFRVDTKVSEANYGRVSPLGIQFTLNPGQVFERMPGEFGPQAIVQGADAAANQRQADLELDEPFVNELHWRLTAPAGFKLTSPAKDSTTKMAHCTLTQSFDRKADNVLIVKLRFDTGDRHFTAKEVNDFRADLRSLGAGGLLQTWNIPVAFQHTGLAHIVAGKHKPGFEEFRRLLSKDSKNSRHHSEFATALIQCGFGDAARSAIRQAIELDPQSSRLHHQLGNVLVHDAMGRKFSSGFDYDGAANAYQKAIELDREQLIYRVSYTALLERDRDGYPFAEGARLAEAIKQYEAVMKAAPAATQVAARLMTAMLHAGEFKKLKAFAAREPLGRLTHLLAATALVDGADAAQRKLKEVTSGRQVGQRPLNILGPAQSADAAMKAAVELGSVRRYDLAVELLEGFVAKTAEDPQWKRFEKNFAGELEVARKRRRFEDASFPESDVRHVIQKMYQTRVGKEAWRDRVVQLVANADEPDDAKTICSQLENQMKFFWRPASASPSRMIDYVMGKLALKSEGDDSGGYRVKADFGTAATWYVVHENDNYRLWEPGFRGSNLGAKSLELLDRGDMIAARRWLDWARQAEGSSGQSLKRFDRSPFFQLWLSANRRDEQHIRTAAAALVASGNGAQAAIDYLTSVRDDAEPERQLQIDRALIRGHATAKQFDKAIKLNEQLIEQFPDERGPLVRQAHNHSLAGDLTKQQAVLETLVERNALDYWANNTLGKVRQKQGNFAAAGPYWRSLIEGGKADDTIYNAISWNALFVGEVTDEMLKLALRMIDNKEKETKSENWHTLASLYASRGKTKEALKALNEALATRGGGIIPDDWYVLGLIAEHCGLREVAIQCYEKLPLSEGVSATDTSILATRRLNALNEQP